MKKILSLIVAITMAIGAMLAFVGCDEIFPVGDHTGNGGRLLG